MIHRNFLMSGIYAGIAAALVGITAPMFSGCSNSKDKPVVSLEEKVDSSEEMVDQRPVNAISVEPTKVDSLLEIPYLNVREVKMTFPDVTERLRKIYKDKLWHVFGNRLFDDKEILDKIHTIDWGWFKNTGDKFPDDIGSIFYARASDRRIFSINPEDKELAQELIKLTGKKNMDRTVSVIDDLIISRDRLSFFVSGKSRYTTEENRPYLVLADIQEGKKLILNTDFSYQDWTQHSRHLPRGYFLGDFTVLVTNKENILFRLKDNKIVFYHPNESILCFTPDMRKLVLHKNGENNHSFHLYDLRDRTEIEFWKDEVEKVSWKYNSFTIRNFHQSFLPFHISKNGRFFAIERRESYQRNMRAWRNGESWIAGSAEFMFSNFVEIYDFQEQETIKLNITNKVPRAVPILGIDDKGNLNTEIGLLKYIGKEYNFEPTKEEIERQKIKESLLY